MSFRVGVVGGTAGMGEWTARFLAKAGNDVVVSGLGEGPLLAEMAASCDVVVLAVPIDVTLDVIAEIGPHMRPGTALMDITSLKEREVAAMLEATAATGAEVVGTHPLFGPSADSVEGRNLITCEGRGTRFLEWIETTFAERGARVTRTSPQQHDEMMAIVQGLEHFSTVATGLALRDLGVPVDLFEPFATPSFDFKVGAIRRVFCDNPRLYGDIMGLNPRNAEVVERYLAVATEMAAAVNAGDADALTEFIQGGTDYYCE